jgi:hypothetical protein
MINDKVRVGTVVQELSKLGQEAQCTRIGRNVRDLLRSTLPRDVFHAEELR